MRWAESYHVVDLQDATDRLCGQGQGADGDQQGLDHQLIQDVGDATLSQRHKACWEISRIKSFTALFDISDNFASHSFSVNHSFKIKVVQQCGESWTLS